MRSFLKHLKNGVAVLSLALAAALVIPAGQQAEAADSTLIATNTDAAAKAEKELLKKAEKLAVDYALAGYSYNYYYGLYDINGDGIPELLCKYTGDESDPGVYTDQENLAVYGYTNKVKLLKKFTNVQYVRVNNNRLYVSYNVMEASDDGWSFPVEYRYESYYINKNGKLKVKNVYRSDNTGDGAYYKNDKEISWEKFWDYTMAFDYYEDAPINNTSKEADEIVAFNSQAASCKLLMAFYSYQWQLSNEAEPLKTKYTATLEKYTNAAATGKELVDKVTVDVSEIENADLFGFGDGDPLPEKKIGKFDLASLGLLDTEEVVFVETVQTSEKYRNTSRITFKTELRPSNASLVLPGFTYPGEDVQGYNLFGTYILDSVTGTLTAEFAYSQKAVEGQHATGLLVPIAVYTISIE